eukprot:CAMPEP_0182822934 /NCGR_PEP_ID=MMETSP0006_2-20121128/14476_1 /TAXON_ID=97485 /ORGANISM="Prymnesium parvum, Strain Texoma1" /LENGTH=108 /DNA_ID=CAMNT_0024949807 /DNA_START=326 /DNA_END=649 /DNA_ORIENTATION=+
MKLAVDAADPSALLPFLRLGVGRRLGLDAPQLLQSPERSFAVGLQILHQLLRRAELDVVAAQPHQHVQLRDELAALPLLQQGDADERLAADGRALAVDPLEPPPQHRR